jgi:hypothetical protein
MRKEDVKNDIIEKRREEAQRGRHKRERRDPDKL